MSLLRTRIDLDAIAHNTRLVKELVGPARLMAVVKADGYNHGMIEVAKTMVANGADALGVATIEEAVQLREAGAPTNVLAWIWDAQADLVDALALNIELGVPSLTHAKALVDAGIPARVSVMVETGMHRSGLEEEDWQAAFTMLRDAEHLTVTGLFSHLACADEPDNPKNDEQAAAFHRALETARGLGLEMPVNHLCNSPATLTRPDLYFEQVRPGLILYGLDPLAGEHGLRPAMSWVGDVVVVKPIKKGESVSYGATWTAERDGYFGIVPCGYADGMPRAIQGKLEVSINGHRYPQVGRVCMDQILVDIGSNPHSVTQSDEAVIFGADGMSATEVAEALDTINYEVVNLPSGRTQRTFVGEG